MVALDEGGKEVYAGPNMDLRAVFEGSAMGRNPRGCHLRYHWSSAILLLYPSQAQMAPVAQPAKIQSDPKCAPLGRIGWRIALQGTWRASPPWQGRQVFWTYGEALGATPFTGELGVELPVYPSLRPAGTLLGGIALDVADSVGLTPDTPVAVGGADTQCGLLGMGVTSEGEAGLVAGWSAACAAGYVSPRVLAWQGYVDRTSRCCPTATLWRAAQGWPGYALDWMIRAFRGRGAGSGMKSLERMVRDVPPGSNGVVALMGPSRMDMGRVGFRLGGIIMPVPTTHYGLDGSHMARAILENIAFAVKSNMTQIESITGRRAGRICVGGGMTNTAVFVQMIAGRSWQGGLQGRASSRQRLGGGYGCFSGRGRL